MTSAPFQELNYRVAPLAVLLQNAAEAKGGRPILDVYLDGVVLLHELLLPIAHGVAPSQLMFEGSLELLQVTSDNLARSPVLQRHLERNLAAYSELLRVQASWYTFVGKTFELLLEGNDSSSADQSDWPRDGFGDAVQTARTSISAARFEYSLIWRVLADVTGMNARNFTSSELAAMFRSVMPKDG